MRATRHPSALGLLLLATACAGDAATRDRPAADTATALAPRPGVASPTRVAATSTSIQVSPSTVAPGAQFIVRFAIRNDSPDTVRMTQSCNAPAIFRLRHAEAAPGSEALEASTCAKVVTTHVVPPGADLVLQLPSVAQAGRPPRPLAPGLYVVEATPNIVEVDGRPLTLRAVSAELRVR